MPSAKGQEATIMRRGRPTTAEPLCGLTVDQVADLLDESTRSAGRWLRGQNDIGTVRLVQLADASGVPIEELAREVAVRLAH